MNPRTIRYYESIGLLPEPQRAPNGYRLYHAADLERIDFIRRARLLGLSLEDIREVLALREAGEAPCPYVLRVVERKIDEIDRQIEGLRALREELRRLHEQAAALPPEVLAAKGRVCHILENRRLAES